MTEPILAALGVAFADFVVWLTVRTINRRERWAKRTAVAIVVLATYPLSFGPACWLVDRDYLPKALPICVYHPWAKFMANHCPDRVCDLMTDYGTWGSGNPGYPSALILLATERIRVYQLRGGSFYNGRGSP